MELRIVSVAHSTYPPSWRVHSAVCAVVWSVAKPCSDCPHLFFFFFLFSFFLRFLFFADLNSRNHRSTLGVLNLDMGDARKLIAGSMVSNGNKKRAVFWGKKKKMKERMSVIIEQLTAPVVRHYSCWGTHYSLDMGLCRNTSLLMCFTSIFFISLFFFFFFNYWSDDI